MDCSICYESISAATGQVSLSCSHHFHLGCIGRWLLKSSSCPLCRGETCEKEKIVVESYEESYEESEESGTTVELDHGGGEPSTIELDVPEFDAAAHALWVMRETFKMLDDGESILSEGSAPSAPSATDEQWSWEQYNDGIVSQVRMRSMQLGNHAWCHGSERGYDSS
jgi:hypothetical protein